MVEAVDQNPLMACGHTGFATHAGAHDGLPKQHPSCPIDMTCVVQPEKPDLTDRMAVCGYHHEGSVPSSWDLAFFEYRGPGSNSAKLCECGYAYVAHVYEPKRVSPEPITCKVGGYTPRGDIGTDTYYDGCFGWD